MCIILQAPLLVIDDRLLRQIAIDALGEDLNQSEESSVTAYLLSFWLAGNAFKHQQAWET